MVESVPTSDTADAILQWLAKEPDDDPVADLGALRARFAEFASSTDVVHASPQTLRQFSARALDACSRLRPRLLTATLPLSREMHMAAGALIDLLLDIASAFQRLAERPESRWLRGHRADAELASVHAFALVNEAFVLVSMAGAAAPAGFWRTAHALGGMVAGGADEDDGGEAGGQRLFHYRRMLSVAVAQPESLTPRELSWLFDYLDSVAMHARLSHKPIEPGAPAYWIDLSSDEPPVAICRQQPPASGRLCYFSPAPIVPHTREQIEWLESRMIDAEVSGLEFDGELLEPDTGGLPLGLAPVEILSVLRRLRDRWAMPPMREQARRRHQYTVQVCIGLRAIWDLGRGVADRARVAEWLVLNESPGGYAIMCVSGVEGSVSAGMALALRRGAAEPWSICIARWVRSDNPDQIELGLQVMSQSFASIQVGFRGSELRTTSPALMLPALPPMRRNAVILAPAGTYTSRRFVLVRDGPQLYVAQGRALGLDMQTANVEMFQYETDPYAL